MKNCMTIAYRVQLFLIAALVAAGSSLLAVSSASAQTTYTWDISAGAGITGGSGTWNTSNTNWTTDGGATNTPWVNAGGTPKNDAIIGGTAGTVTLGEPIAIRNLTINTASYIITGDTLNFTSGNINIAAGGANKGAATTIRSAITGSPTMTDGGTSGTHTILNPTSGSMTLGAVTRAVDKHLYLQGLAGSNNSLASIAKGHNNAKLYVESGNWTFGGNVYAGEFSMTGGSLVLNGTLSNDYRSIDLSNGTLHYNNPGAIRDNVNVADNLDFRITGGSIDQTSGAAITTSTTNPRMRWNGNWTFIGSNGASSNLYLGNGAVILNATRQITVTNAAATLTVGGVIDDGASTFGLTKAGAGTLALSGANTYNGATTISAGTLRISGTGSINGSSGITLNGGQLDYTSSVALTAPLTFTSGTLGGTSWTGSTLNNLTIGASRTISPGNSPGTANTVDQTWDTDGTYQFEINSVAGSAGSDPGWDLLAGTGTLTITATSVDPFVIDLTSLDLGNNPNPVVNFDETQSYEWLIADFANPVSGFDASKFFVDDTNFDNAYTGNFSVALGTSVGGDNTQIFLTYVAVPEPTTLAILGAAVALVGFRVARRRVAATR
jgi:fibronectin-binding autotransporter adhesin